MGGIVAGDGMGRMHCGWQGGRWARLELQSRWGWGAVECAVTATGRGRLDPGGRVGLVAACSADRLACRADRHAGAERRADKSDGVS